MSRSWDEVFQRFQEIEFLEQFDMIVAVANGGILPASILNQKLQIDFQTIKINLRDQFQKPKYEKPQLLEPVNFDFTGKKILLVDDRIKTGSSIKLAKEVLKEAAVIKTFAVNGNADYCLYNENCFRFPWII